MDGDLAAIQLARFQQPLGVQFELGQPHLDILFLLHREVGHDADRGDPLELEHGQRILLGIGHSLCTLEFEDHRPLYDWVLDNLDIPCHPRQYEFSRLELFYTVTSKRKLNQLVTEKLVAGWDDPRMPTIAGMRRRGYTPEGIRLFARRIGISKSDNHVDMSVLEGAVREELEHSVPRVMAVINPLKVTLTNYTEGVTAARSAGFHPNHPEFGEREVPLSAEIWIERDDFSDNPPAGWQRLTPGGEVRLRYSYVIKCDDVVRDAAGEVIELRCSIDHDTLGKNPVGRKVKGVIHFVAAAHALPIEVRLYDRLFSVPRPDAMKDEAGAEIDFKTFINPDSLSVVTGYAEPALAQAQPEARYQFERIGYFCADRRGRVGGWRQRRQQAAGGQDQPPGAVVYPPSLVDS